MKRILLKYCGATWYGPRGTYFCPYAIRELFAVGYARELEICVSAAPHKGAYRMRLYASQQNSLAITLSSGEVIWENLVGETAKYLHARFGKGIYYVSVDIVE